jgi:hypothetical protein
MESVARDRAGQPQPRQADYTKSFDELQEVAGGLE